VEKVLCRRLNGTTEVVPFPNLNAAAEAAPFQIGFGSMLSGVAGEFPMKAVRIHQFGGPEVLTYEDVRDPQPRKDQSANTSPDSPPASACWLLRCTFAEAA
jgi:hypothetical protein